MQQFEYKTYKIKVNNGLFTKKDKLDLDAVEEEINLLGKKGWELVTQFSRQSNGFSQFAVLIFKRPLVRHSKSNTEMS